MDELSDTPLGMFVFDSHQWPCELDIRTHTFTQRNGHFRQTVSHAQGHIKIKRRDDDLNEEVLSFIQHLCLLCARSLLQARLRAGIVSQIGSLRLSG